MMTTDWITALPRAMDDATSHLKNGDIVPAFGILGNGMTEIWANAYMQGQVDRAIATVKEHELFSIAHQDPYSNRAYKKPRGYAGDAVMMDYVYAGVAVDGTTDLGKAVFTGTTRGSMGLSVLFRRHLLTAHINQVASSCSDFKILSVASGHCREVEGSLLANPALAKAGRLVAFDQDPESCETVKKDYADYPVDVVCASVHKLLAGDESHLGKFDLIYSAGLFDYLIDPVAEKLIAALASMLKPGECQASCRL
jgi:extracellular factor (EF) 3-hydroxypalmitic acid methyl ester biosynthesis protein